MLGSEPVSALRSLKLPGPTGPKDVASRVDVGVSTMATTETSEHGPAPVPRRDEPTPWTRPARVAGVHCHYLSTGALGLVADHGEQVSPPGVEN